MSTTSPVVQNAVRQALSHWSQCKKHPQSCIAISIAALLIHTSAAQALPLTSLSNNLILTNDFTNASTGERRLTWNGLFSVEDASMWNGSTGATFNVSGSKSLGWDSEFAVGGYETILGTQNGATLSGTTNGNVSVGLDLHATSGRVDVELPFKLEILLDNQFNFGANAIKTKLDIDDGFNFATLSPDVGLRTFMGIDMNASIAAETCAAGVCLAMPETEVANFSNDIEVFAANYDPSQTGIDSFDQKIRLLGQEEILGFNFTDAVTSNFGKDIDVYKGIVSVHYGEEGQTNLLPSINTNSSQLSDGSLRANGDVIVGGVDVNLTKLLTDSLNKAAIPVPPLEGTLDELTGQTGNSVVDALTSQIGYNLFSGSVGLDVGFEQNFDLARPEFMFDLNIGGTKHSVDVGVGEWLDQSIVLDDNAAWLSGGGLSFNGSLQTSDMTFTNQTNLLLNPAFDIASLGVGFGPLEAGPIVEETYALPLPSIPVFNESFNLNATPLTTDTALTFQLDSSPIVVKAGIAVIGDPESSRAKIADEAFDEQVFNLQLKTDFLFIDDSRSGAAPLAKNSNITAERLVFDDSFTLQDSILGAEDGSLMIIHHSTENTTLNLYSGSTLKNAILGSGDILNLVQRGSSDDVFFQNVKMDGKDNAGTLNISQDTESIGGWRKLAFVSMQDSHINNATGVRIDIDGGINTLSEIKDGEVHVRSGKLTLKKGHDFASFTKLKTINTGSETETVAAHGSAVRVASNATLEVTEYLGVPEWIKPKLYVEVSENAKLILNNAGGDHEVKFENAILTGQGSLSTASGSKALLEGITTAPGETFNDITLAGDTILKRVNVTAETISINGVAQFLANPYTKFLSLINYGSANPSSLIAHNGFTVNGHIKSNSKVKMTGSTTYVSSTGHIEFERLTGARQWPSSNYDPTYSTMEFDALQVAGRVDARGRLTVNDVTTITDGGMVKAHNGSIIYSDINLQGGLVWQDAGAELHGNINNISGIYKTHSQNTLEGNLQQSGSGLLELLFDGDFTQPFNVTGSGLLGGFLSIDLGLSSGSNWGIGDSFDALMFGGGYTGVFTGYSFMNDFLESTMHWVARYETNKLVFEVQSLAGLTNLMPANFKKLAGTAALFNTVQQRSIAQPNSSIPEPKTVLLYLAGLLSFFLRRKKAAV